MVLCEDKDVRLGGCSVSQMMVLQNETSDFVTLFRPWRSKASTLFQLVVPGIVLDCVSMNNDFELW